MIKRLGEYALILVLVPALSLVAAAVLLGVAYGTIGIGARYEIFYLPLAMFVGAWFSGWFAAWKTGNIKVDAPVPKLLSAIFGALVFLLVVGSQTHHGVGTSGYLHWSEGLTLLIGALAGPFLGVRFRARQRAKQSGS